MKIILAPAKKMREDTDVLAPSALPCFLEDTEILLDWLHRQTPAQLQKLWQCNDKIAAQNVERLRTMDLRRKLTPAVLAYDGIAYRYMAPTVFENSQFEYVQEHLRILSGFYGVLRPMDGVTPYRLEMQVKAAIPGYRDLYDFWGSRLYEAVRDDSSIIVNLASGEYSKCIARYLRPEDRFLTITFCEKSGDKLLTKGTYAKMARGEMVRYMAEHRIEDIEEIKGFDRLGYVFHEELSVGKEFVFERISCKIE